MRKGKFFKSLVTLTCAGIITCGAFGCGGGSVSESDITAWSVDSLQKVLQEEGVKENAKEFKVEVFSAKGESESAQVILTPTKKVNSLTVEVADLKTSDGTVLSSSCVDVYLQRYINILMKTYNQKNEACPEGWYPDFLLPIDVAKDYNENYINENMNQGITFDYAIPENQKAGVYTGNYIVKLDGVSLTLPVTVTVWDYTLQGANGQTLFQVWRRTLMPGEMSNDLETYTNYYEYTLDELKSCLQYVPHEEGTGESMAQAVIKYWDHPNFTTYTVPIFGKTYDYSFASNEFYQYAYALVKNSTPERILTDKATVYLTTTDEPSNGNAYRGNREIMLKIREIWGKVVAELDSEGFFDGKADFKSAVETSLNNVAIITTSSDVENYSDYIDTYCPPIQHFETSYMRDLYLEHEQQNSGNTWMYTCMQPIYPYPSHHTDDFLVGARILRYMQKKYDLDGYLYWGIAEYYNQGSDTMIHPYNDSTRYTMGDQSYNGDGCWLYPGEKYGSDKPFPSLRSLSVRDAQEDYDTLCVLDELLNGLSRTYGKDFNSNAVLNEVYETLISGCYYNMDNAEFFKCRQTVAEIISNLTNGAVVYSETDNDAKTYNVFAPTGSTVKINGENVSVLESEKGVEYKYVQALDGTKKSVKIEVETNGVTSVYEYGLSKVYKATDFASNSMESISLSQYATSEFDGEKAVFTIKSYGEELADKLAFKPKIDFGKALFGKMNEIDTLSFELTNCGTIDFTVNINLYQSSSVFKTIEKVSLKAGETKKVYINRVYDIKNINLSNYNGIRFAFDNVDKNNNTLPDRMIGVGEIYFTKKGGK